MVFAEFSLFPEQASTLAPRVDAVFFYILGVTVFFSTLIAVLLLVFAVRYRRRGDDHYPQPTRGSLRLEIGWTVVPIVLVLVMFLWGASVFSTMKQAPPDAMEVYVVGRQWMWKIQYPEGQRVINKLYVPVGRPVKLIVTSEDVIHSFYVPAFRTKIDAVPGRYNTTWFEATRPGTYHLFCAEYCGTEHSRMIGSVIALEPTEFEEWLAESPDGSMAQEGRKLFSKLLCISCHADGQALAPSLGGVYGQQIPLTDGRTVRADEGYLRRAILQPAEDVVAGYQPIMPTFQGQVGEEELLKLIAFIKSLPRGEPLPRVEETAPPEATPASTQRRSEKE